MGLWIKDLTINDVSALLSRDSIAIGKGRNMKHYYKDYIGFDIESIYTCKHVYIEPL